MPRPYIVPIVSDFVATPLRSGALVLSISSSSLFTILLDNKELSDPVSKIVLETTIVLALSGAIILVFIVITSLADFRFTMPIPAVEMGKMQDFQFIMCIMRIMHIMHIYTVY